MKPFKLGPACRLETHATVWDSSTGKWVRRKLSKPRLVENTPPVLDDEQKAFLKEYVQLLGEKIKCDTHARRRQDAAIEEYFFWSDAGDAQ